ncbi:MAG: cyclase family protein [Pseudomonadota bacterium]
MTHGRSIARLLDFDGRQPSYYGAPDAFAEPMRGGSFVGDTRSGGSCNASVLTLNPHCNGTHTECVGHVTEERRNVVDVLPYRRIRALLVSLPATRAATCDERTPDSCQSDDLLLCARDLQRFAGAALAHADALVVRTLPNTANKATRQYLDNDDYPYFTHDALDAIVAADIHHLLIDTPSLDRLDDGGKLALHRHFWNLPAGATSVNDVTRADCTITEMIYVPDDIVDGEYQLALQHARFSGDAVPSNPVLYALDEAAL